ncbi:MAG: plastocyanin/azurin family copper-binding protein [Acidimicrobiia bacterium]|nr:plastocyanin/azurin family copper-binding protein [Acidimicrobiia bacterium]MDH5503018.1 plastocyanin/azurin family copper-binding protein [Acidimicrobiia bacterium]
MNKKLLIPFVAGLMLLAVPALAATKTVKLTADNKFVAATTSISVGDSVTFTWDGGFHDVVFADGQKSGAPVGDVGTTYTRTFSAAGTYNFVCTVHEALGMKGSITVAAPAGGGGTTSGGSNTGAQNLPSTGPEDTVLPALGVGLIAVGAVWYVRSRAEE